MATIALTSFSHNLYRMTISGLILQASLVSKRQLHVISRSKTNIKPASPTPLELKHHNLPSHDRMMVDFYSPVIFFYQNPQPQTHETTISDLLKKSLSQTLSKYYPFAGRLSSSGSYVECKDEGVLFLEAQVAGKLSEVLEKAPLSDGEKRYGHLFPPGSIWRKESYFLMSVQLSQFSCGGIAIAVSLSHRIADGATLFSFLSYWASLSSNSIDQDKQAHLHPCFVHKLLPGSYDNDVIATKAMYPKIPWITAEILFPNSKIAELKAELELQDKLHGIYQKYTRTELVTALLYRCTRLAAATSKSETHPKSVMLQTVNMRPLIDPPLPKTSVGNLYTFNHIPTSTISELELSQLIGRMKKGMMQLRGVKTLEGKEIIALVNKYRKNDHKICIISSICNFPVYDGTDFGWGRPVKATIVDAPIANSIFMMDTPRKDGIMTTVTLEEEDMKNFLVDKELLTYASF